MLRTYLFIGCLLHYIALRSPYRRLYRVESMVWFWYRILRHTWYSTYKLYYYTYLFIGAPSLFQSGVCHIHDHTHHVRSTFAVTCICAIYIQSVPFGSLHLHPVHIYHIYTSSFYLFSSSLRVVLVDIAVFILHTTSISTISTAARMISYFLVYHLWWLVLYCIINAEGSLTCKLLVLFTIN